MTVAGLKAARARGRKGGEEVRADESPGAAGPGRDGAPRHVGVRPVPRTRHQAGDALQVRRAAGRAARAGPEGPRILKPEDHDAGRAKRRISPPPANNPRMRPAVRPLCSNSNGPAGTPERRWAVTVPTAWRSVSPPRQLWPAGRSVVSSRPRSGPQGRAHGTRSTASSLSRFRKYPL